MRHRGRSRDFPRFAQAQSPAMSFNSHTENFADRLSSARRSCEISTLFCSKSWQVSRYRKQPVLITQFNDMKKLSSLFALVVAVSVLTVGCGDGKEIFVLDTLALETAFADSSGTAKDEIDAAVSAFGSEKTLSGVESLMEAAGAGGLNEDQIDALWGMIEVVGKWQTNSEENYADLDITKALEDLAAKLDTLQ
jgi:hypothetical protein